MIKFVRVRSMSFPDNYSFLRQFKLVCISTRLKHFWNSGLRRRNINEVLC